MEKKSHSKFKRVSLSWCQHNCRACIVFQSLWGTGTQWYKIRLFSFSQNVSILTLSKYPRGIERSVPTWCSQNGTHLWTFLFIIVIIWFDFHSLVQALCHLGISNVFNWIFILFSHFSFLFFLDPLSDRPGFVSPVPPAREDEIQPFQPDRFRQATWRRQQQQQRGLSERRRWPVKRCRRRKHQ